MRRYNVKNLRGLAPKVRYGGQSSLAGAVHTAAAFLICLVVASLMPAAVMAAALKTMLYWAAIAIAAGAVLSREPHDAARLTHWDKAAILLLLGLLAGLFIDPEAMPRSGAAG